MNLQTLLEQDAARAVLTRGQRRAVRDADTELKRLRERVTVLETAGRAVLASWESGDLATAVRELGLLLGEEPPTRVHFRTFPGGDVIALFPDIPHSVTDDGTIMSYQHIGQHGAASRELIAELPAAVPEEYAPLQRELESLGYRLEVLG